MHSIVRKERIKEYFFNHLFFFLHFISCIEETKDFVVKIDVIRNRKGDYGDALDVALKILADFIEIFLF